MTTKHDLIFFEKRSTPKVIAQGQRFIAPESYGKQTRRRPATEAEEKQIANGQWVRVDEHGNKGGDPNYKETRMAGREHLVHELTQAVLAAEPVLGVIQDKPSLDDALTHYGKKGMRWGQRSGAKPTDAEITKARQKVNVTQGRIVVRTAKTLTSRGDARKANKKALKTLKTKHLRNPDRATALRMTKGEKYLTAALVVAAPPVGVPRAGVAAYAFGKRKVIERNQARAK